MIYQSNTIQVHEIRDGIVQLTFCAGTSINKLDQTTLVALDEAINITEQSLNAVQMKMYGDTFDHSALTSPSSKVSFKLDI